MQRIAVVDYGMGNLRSVSKAIEHVASDAEVLVTADIDVIDSADRIVCPGQGAARDCMSALGSFGLAERIPQWIADRPFLGICMGLQVLFTHSDENEGIRCLNVVEGTVKHFSDADYDESGNTIKIPHMGWSRVHHSQQHPLWDGIATGSRFYFAHSYYCVPADMSDAVGNCHYGVDFSVAVARENLFACQFHPEKSADDGLQLLRNFARWKVDTA